jgi:hypothetical protein
MQDRISVASVSLHLDRDMVETGWLRHESLRGHRADATAVMIANSGYMQVAVAAEIGTLAPLDTVGMFARRDCTDLFF